MPHHFRCYFMSGDGHIAAAVNIDAESAEEAAGVAAEDSRAARATAIEVWSGAARLYEHQLGTRKTSDQDYPPTHGAPITP